MNSKIFLAAGLAAMMAAPAAQAQLSWGNFYGNLGVSYVDLQREKPADPLITRDSKNGVGLGFGFGYRITPKISVELGRQDLGTVRITDATPGGPNYADESAVAVVTAVKINPWNDWKFSPFLRVGNARTTYVETDSTGSRLRESRNRTYASVGVDYQVTDKVRLGLGYDHYWSADDNRGGAGRPSPLKPRALSLSTSVSF
jgi:outer membrane protein W